MDIYIYIYKQYIHAYVYTLEVQLAFHFLIAWWVETIKSPAIFQVTPNFIKHHPKRNNTRVSMELSN